MSVAEVAFGRGRIGDPRVRPLFVVVRTKTVEQHLQLGEIGRRPLICEPLLERAVEALGLSVGPVKNVSGYNELSGRGDRLVAGPIECGGGSPRPGPSRSHPRRASSEASRRRRRRRSSRSRMSLPNRRRAAAYG
jgi:hypothetical protein